MFPWPAVAHLHGHCSICDADNSTSRLSLSVALLQENSTVSRDRDVMTCLSKWYANDQPSVKLLTCRRQLYAICNCMPHSAPSSAISVPEVLVQSFHMCQAAMHRGMSSRFGVFSYDKPYHKLQAMEVLTDMFNSQDVQQHLQVCCARRCNTSVLLAPSLNMLSKQAHACMAYILLHNKHAQAFAIAMYFLCMCVAADSC